MSHTVYKLGFNVILCLNIISLCFKLIIIHNHTPKQNEIRIKTRILNHNIHLYCNRFPTMESVSLTLTFHTTLASGARSKEWQALPSPARPGLARSWPGLPGKRGLEKPGKPGSRPGFWGKPGYRSMAFPATLKSRPPFHGFLGEKTRSRESQEFVAIFYKWQQ